jgi:hypothetical protein
MKLTLKRTASAVLVALGVIGLAGCDRAPDTGPKQTPPSTSGAGGTAQSNTPSTPANMGQPSQAERKEGSNPTQGQVDPKEPEQRKDFQQKGDAAGPKQ